MVKKRWPLDGAAAAGAAGAEEEEEVSTAALLTFLSSSLATGAADEDDDDGESSQQRPLSRAALEQKVIKIVKKREYVQSEREKQRYGTDLTLTKK